MKKLFVIILLSFACIGNGIFAQEGRGGIAEAALMTRMMYEHAQQNGKGKKEEISKIKKILKSKVFWGVSCLSAALAGVGSWYYIGMQKDENVHDEDLQNNSSDEDDLSGENLSDDSDNYVDSKIEIDNDIDVSDNEKLESGNMQDDDGENIIKLEEESVSGIFNFVLKDKNGNIRTKKEFCQENKKTIIISTVVSSIITIIGLIIIK